MHPEALLAGPDLPARALGYHVLPQERVPAGVQGAEAEGAVLVGMMAWKIGAFPVTAYDPPFHLRPQHRHVPRVVPLGIVLGPLGWMGHPIGRAP